MLKYLSVKLLTSVLISISVIIMSFNVFAAIEEPDTINASIESNGTTINLLQGQFLELKLVTNPSTGYSWRYVSEIDNNILSEISHDIIKPANPMPGAKEEEVWTFEAVGCGETSIQLEYLRTWEPNSTIKTFTLNIIVDENNNVIVVPSIEKTDNKTMMKLSITNNLKSDITITHPTSQTADFALQEILGVDLYRWSEGRMFLQLITYTQIASGETIDLLESDVVEPCLLNRSNFLKAYITGYSNDFDIQEDGYLLTLDEDF
jgi:predicted secreted protein